MIPYDFQKLFKFDEIMLKRLIKRKRFRGKKIYFKQPYFRDKKYKPLIC
jgi:hypothetical protein